jgi:hypothetical protein
MVKNNNYIEGNIRKNVKHKIDQEEVSVYEKLNYKKPFHLSSPYLLQYKEDSLFSKEFMIQVKEILGNKEDFLKLPVRDQRQLQFQLEDLYNMENR